MRSTSILKFLLISLVSLLLIDGSFASQGNSKIDSSENFNNNLRVPTGETSSITDKLDSFFTRKLDDEMNLENTGLFAGTLRLVGILIIAPIWIIVKTITCSVGLAGYTVDHFLWATEFYSSFSKMIMDGLGN